MAHGVCYGCSPENPSMFHLCVNKEGLFDEDRDCACAKPECARHRKVFDEREAQNVPRIDRVA